MTINSPTKSTQRLFFYIKLLREKVIARSLSYKEWSHTPNAKRKRAWRRNPIPYLSTRYLHSLQLWPPRFNSPHTWSWRRCSLERDHWVKIKVSDSKGGKGDRHGAWRSILSTHHRVDRWDKATRSRETRGGELGSLPNSLAPQQEVSEPIRGVTKSGESSEERGTRRVLFVAA